MFSVYLRPWTLAGKIASRAVPHLADLADAGAMPRRGVGEDGDAATPSKCIRGAWKAYTRNILPHAARQISNFMLACLAEGRRHDQDDEDAFKRGGAITCELTSDEITALMNCSKQHDKQSAEQDGSTGAHARSAQVESGNGHAKRIAATTSLALRLADASKSPEQISSIPAKSLLHNQRKVTRVVRKDEDVEDLEELRECVVSRHTHDWEDAYALWVHNLYDKVIQKGIVPNPKQQEILQVVHRRCVLEWECKSRAHSNVGGEASTDQSCLEDPLLRLVHGLPGSGKSKVLEWMRSYFEVVWKWTSGKEFVFLATLNSMASNIGGFTFHGWGEVLSRMRGEL